MALASYHLLFGMTGEVITSFLLNRAVQLPSAFLTVTVFSEAGWFGLIFPVISYTSISSHCDTVQTPLSNGKKRTNCLIITSQIFLHGVCLQYVSAVLYTCQGYCMTLCIAYTSTFLYIEGVMYRCWSAVHSDRCQVGIRKQE